MHGLMARATRVVCADQRDSMSTENVTNVPAVVDEAAPVVPPESDAELHLPQAFLESTLFSFVIFRAILDERTLDAP